MTTVLAERDTWDTFLIEDVERQYKLPEAREYAMLGRSQHIEGFRATEWRSIKDQLKRKYLWVLHVEPHWTEPGAAVFWQRQTVRVRGRDPEGRPAILDEEKGWAATSPLPANNASQIAYHLTKGLLLRHPEKGVSVEKLQHAEPAGAAQDENVEPDGFTCDRHKGNHFGFKTWKAYRIHCDHWKETIDREQVPTDFEVGDHQWYCFAHGIGWKENNSRGALQHLVKHPRMELTALEVGNGTDEGGSRGRERPTYSAISPVGVTKGTSGGLGRNTGGERAGGPNDQTTQSS